MAGLLTARVLSTHFDKVVVVESEDLVNESTERKHILQFWHIHAYLPVAYSVMKSLFNSFDEAASEAGGMSVLSIRTFPINTNPLLKQCAKDLLYGRNEKYSCSSKN